MRFVNLWLLLIELVKIQVRAFFSRCRRGPRGKSTTSCLTEVATTRHGQASEIEFDFHTESRDTNEPQSGFEEFKASDGSRFPNLCISLGVIGSSSHLVQPDWVPRRDPIFIQRIQLPHLSG